jgi:hypothetical protein
MRGGVGGLGGGWIGTFEIFSEEGFKSSELFQNYFVSLKVLR